jgi:hypothetical protein
MTTSTINGLASEQTTQLTDDSFLMQTAAGITKKIKATNMKLVGYDDYIFVHDPATVTGSPAPALKTFRGGLKAAAFAGTGSTDEVMFGNVHILHNYVAGTVVSFHIHWSHINASPTGNVVWQIEYSIAKGYGVEAFPATTTITLVQAAGTQYFHHIIEGSNITNSSIEPDSLVLMRIFRNASHASDTFADDAFFLRCDMHVSVDNRPTNEKARPFTKV